MKAFKCPELPVTAARTILPQRVYIGGFRIVDSVVVMNRVHRIVKKLEKSHVKA